MSTALYIHIPYCTSKCPYCDFASVPLDTSVWAYLHALMKEAAKSSEALHFAETVYIGGGTPTLLTADQICWLFKELRHMFRFSPRAEITVEANPCSLEPEKTWALAANGVNRVSLGIQSFIDDELRLLGRRHKVECAVRGFSALREAGMSNISIDLIYAIPNQSPANWRYSLEQAIGLGPEHISAYCLTYEQRTPFWRLLQHGKIEKKSDEEELDFYEVTRKMLTRAGYEHYEISNYALPGKRSKHNMVYWSNEEYLGLGAGAFSYRRGTRTANLREPKDYIEAIETKGSATCEVDEISPGMQAIESVIQRLRVREGIDCHAFMKRFGLLPQDVCGDALSELVELDLLDHGSERIRPRLKGWHLADEVALKILP